MSDECPEDTTILISRGCVEVHWLDIANEICNQARGPSSLIGGPEFCRSCRRSNDCPLARYRELVEYAQGSLQRQYNDGFETPPSALDHLHKALYYACVDAKEQHILMAVASELASKWREYIELEILNGLLDTGFRNEAQDHLR